MWNIRLIAFFENVDSGRLLDEAPTYLLPGFALGQNSHEIE